MKTQQVHNIKSAAQMRKMKRVIRKVRLTNIEIFHEACGAKSIGLIHEN